MARTVTFTTLKQRIRDRVNIPSTSFVPEVELERRCNVSMARWYSAVARAEPERFMATQAIVANGSAQYAFPADYESTLDVEYNASSGDAVSLDTIPFMERNNFASSNPSGKAAGYRLNATGVVLVPAVPSGNYTHYYLPVAPTLGDGTGGTVTSYDGVNGWDEWIVLDVAVGLRSKEETNADNEMMERKLIWDEIRMAAQTRQLRGRRVVDTRYRRRIADDDA